MFPNIRRKSPSIISSPEFDSLQKEFQKLENISFPWMIDPIIWSNFIEELRKEIKKLNSISINNYSDQKKLVAEINYYINLIKITRCMIDQPSDAHIASFENELTMPNWKKTLLIAGIVLVICILFCTYFPILASNVLIAFSLIMTATILLDPNNNFREGHGHCLQKIKETYIYNNFQNAGIKLFRALKNLSSYPVSSNGANPAFFITPEPNTPRTPAPPSYEISSLTT